jgi:hypothetical protein
MVEEAATHMQDVDSRPPEQRSTRSCAIDDEHMLEELVPAGAPKIRDRRGRPWAVGSRRPLPHWLLEDDVPDERRDVVEHVDVCVHHHAATQGVQARKRPAGEHAQRRVEYGVACGVIDGGLYMLHEV